MLPPLDSCNVFCDFPIASPLPLLNSGNFKAFKRRICIFELNCTESMSSGLGPLYDLDTFFFSLSRKRFLCDSNASICKLWHVAGIPSVSHSRFSGIFVQRTDLTRTHSRTTHTGSCQALLFGRPRMPQCLFIVTDCLATMQGQADSVRLARAPRSISDITEDYQEHQGHAARLWRLKMDKPPATETEPRAAQAIGLFHEHDGTDTLRSPHTSLTFLARSLSKSSVLDARSPLGPVRVPATFGHSCRCQLFPRTLTYRASRSFDNDAGSR